MKLGPRTLYAKIFLWFCVTVAGSIAVVFSVAGLTGSQPFGRRYVMVTQDLYARTAVDLYTSGGAGALTRYTEVLARNSGLEGHLLALPSSNGVLGEAVPAQDAAVLRQALQTGRSAAHFDRHFWTAASIVDPATAGPHRRYVFVLSARPLRFLLDGAFFQLILPRLAGGLLLVALFCLLLARHITRPISVLQSAATRMAQGDLRVRTLPALAGRSDELAAMAAAFDSMAERIEGLLQTERQMLADISHELRSPLTRIAVSVELLRRGETDVLAPMEADLDRLNMLIGQILELSRFELQQPAIARGEVDLSELMLDLIASATYEGRHLEKSVGCNVPSAPCLVPGHEIQLRSCLENVVRNALQHSGSGQSIFITLECSNADEVTVSVEDDGPGVPEASLPRIFDPFFRVPEAGADHPQGSGLGLSIAARIVQRHGGTIEAKNRSPHGLCVSVMLPRT